MSIQKTRPRPSSETNQETTTRSPTDRVQATFSYENTSRLPNLVDAHNVVTVSLGPDGS